MTNASSTLEIEDLPARSRSLSADDLSDVFGGAQTQGKACKDNFDCAGSATCKKGSSASASIFGAGTQSQIFGGPNSGTCSSGSKSSGGISSQAIL